MWFCNAPRSSRGVLSVIEAKYSLGGLHTSDGVLVVGDEGLGISDGVLN